MSARPPEGGRSPSPGRWRAAAALALASLVPAAVLANDSTGRIGSSGLVLVQSASIEMREEILTISVDRIDVRYRYVNTGAAEVDTLVAFPMPSFGWNPGRAQWDTHVAPMRGFTTRIDGVERPAQVDVKAFLGGRDITRDLLSTGLGSDRIVRGLQCDPVAVARECWGEVKPVLVEREYVTPQGWPKWEAQETAYWPMKFPPRKEVRVEHSYSPLVGASYAKHQPGQPLLAGHPWADFGNKDTSEGCVDENTARQVEAARRRIKVPAGAQGSWWLTMRDVEYVLGTGRNWKGPIQRFVLRIEKAAPTQVVSLCFPAKPRRSDDRVVEYEVRNFVPQDKLVVYFYDLSWESQ